jgi:ferredoxin-fold anticodon binding domain-containing protein
MRRSFDREYILREFRRIDAQLGRELQVYMIGGGAMALAGIKEATKDVDVIVMDDRDVRRLVRALEGLGYQGVPRPGREYMRMGASFILENVDGFRWDVFVAQIMRKLMFSESMRGRTRGFGEYNKLKIGLASNSDIFLFKSITEREGDLEDMSSLVRAGIDSEVLLQEIGVQRKLLGTEIWVTYLNEKLTELDERYGIALPIKEQIDEMARKVYDKLEVTLLLRKGEMSMEELKERAEMSMEELKKAVEDLLSRKIIKKVDGRFRLISDKL